MNGRKAMRFPDGTVARNVTLVRTGLGDYLALVPSRGPVVKDRKVEAARRDWPARYGYG